MKAKKHICGMLVWFVCLVFITGCATTPESHMKPLPQAPMPPPQGPRFNESHYQGSLWNNRSPHFFQDLRARNVGDLITVIINEEASAKKEGTTYTEKKKTLSAALNFLGLTLDDKKKLGKSSTSYSGSLNDKHDTQGKITKDDTMTAYLTARVIAVEPNGNLVIKGSRWTRVTGEELQIFLEGVVRPSDITANNTVLSQNIADARIYFNGKGPVTTVQLPGWVSILLSFISPF